MGHGNLRPAERKSVLTADPAILARFAGHGHALGGRHLGDVGFRETVDFGSTIGLYWDDKALAYVPTAWGTIRYRQNGTIHIVPTPPTPRSGP